MPAQDLAAARRKHTGSESRDTSTQTDTSTQEKTTLSGFAWQKAALFECLHHNTEQMAAMRWPAALARLEILTKKRAELKAFVATHKLSFVDPELSKLTRFQCRNVHWLQEQVGLSDEQKISLKPESGYWKIDEVRDIQHKMKEKGREVIFFVGADEKGAEVAYAYYTHRIIKGHELKTEAKELYRALKPKDLPAQDLATKLKNVTISYGHELVFPKNSALTQHLFFRPALAVALSIFALEEEYKMGVTLSLASCRFEPKLNSAIFTHDEMGWAVLDTSVYGLNETADVNTFGQTIHLKDAILWNTPTEQHVLLAKGLRKIFNLRVEDRDSPRDRSIEPAM